MFFCPNSIDTLIGEFLSKFCKFLQFAINKSENILVVKKEAGYQMERRRFVCTLLMIIVNGKK
jgi:hypothetical protein